MNIVSRLIFNNIVYLSLHRIVRFSSVQYKLTTRSIHMKISATCLEMSDIDQEIKAMWFFMFDLEKVVCHYT